MQIIFNKNILGYYELCLCVNMIKYYGQIN